ncbi:divalent metal cation transporter [Prauserella marina]|uniref:Manganese transport protein n=1 Tax=Prauserella marina TaxID=530584 RepID=A0A222VQS3_9PSEU|nr:Nramp family divalent metal transporter [Prauserella marina]ASR36081.1 divalent metal cation transporter [Prauserella marina]PWV76811.1 manganese transport protein [Prauserella marina]SDC98121.1 manganese transport protein [Prauserella marina]
MALLDGMRPRLARAKTSLLLLGPAFVAAVAYVDPGNVAANVSAGAQFGYLLVWVLVAANLMAGLVQYLSAKLGLVTGLSLPEALRDRLGKPARLGYWAQAELVAIATDIAEVVGGAIALYLLFGLPLVVGGIITGIVSLFLLAVYDKGGPRRFERVITGFLLIIATGFLVGVVVEPPSPTATLDGLIPRFSGTESVLLAAAMLGATIMPHAVYLHSGLARDRHGHTTGTRLRRLLKTTKLDVGLAMVLAGAVNIGMLLLAATNLKGQDNVDSIEGAHSAVQTALGPVVGLLFAVGLLASGLASTSVGAYAGAMIMQGLLRKRYPLLLRRLVTLLPALLVLAIGVDPSRALVLSQVVLSFGIPFALAPLVRLTSDRRLMGEATNHVVTTTVAWLVACVIIVLNVALLYLTFA